MPRLTVFLPALNAQDTVATAVSSTLRDMPTDAQLYVLDDGSVDNTAAKAEEGATRKGVTDPRLKIVSKPPSGGLAKALNSMLAETDSELIGRMDADDVTLPGRFPASLRAVDNHCDVVFTQVTWLKGRKISLGLPVPVTTTQFPVNLLLTNPVAHPTMLARRYAFDQAGHFRQVPSEDYDLWLRMATHGLRLRRLAINGMVCRAVDGQVTAAPGWRHNSWNNPLQAEAYADLAERLTGTRLQRLVMTAQLNPTAREPHLREFENRLSALINTLPRWQQPLLRRRLVARLKWARTYPYTPSNPAKELSEDD